jgi:hypothetical protein
MEDNAITLFGIMQFTPSITFGNLLTLITLIGGFLWWSYNNMKKWRAESKDMERRGLNRLLLKIMREHGGAIKTSELLTIFNSISSSEKKEYCGNNVTLGTVRELNPYIYSLVYDHMIDFVESDTVIFRTDKWLAKELQNKTNIIDESLLEKLFSVTESELNKLSTNDDTKLYEAEDLVRLCSTLDKNRMVSLLFDYLSGSDENKIKPYALLLARVQR